MSGENVNQLFLEFDDHIFKENVSETLVTGALVIEKEYLSLKIREVFTENKFNTFRRFCELNQVEYIGDLTSQLIIHYSYGRGVGLKKVAGILKQLQTLDQVNIINHIEPAEKYRGHEAVSLVFGEQSFHHFLEYCQKNERLTVDDLDFEFLRAYFEQKGVGEKKATKILERLEPYTEEAYQGNLNQPFSCGPIFEKLNGLKISEICKLLNISFEFKQDMYIQDLEGEKIDNIQRVIPMEILVPFMGELQKVKTLPMIFEELKEYLTHRSDRDWTVLKLKANEGATLQSVANQMNITRERVRQLINKTGQKLDAYFTQVQLLKTLKLYSENGVNISFESFLKIIGDDYEFILKTLAEHSTLLHYIKEFDTFYFESIETNEAYLEQWRQELPETFNYVEQQEKIDDLLNKFQIIDFKDSDLERLLKPSGYKKHGEVYSKNGLTIVKVAEYLLQHYIKGPFKLDEKGIVTFQKYAKKYLNFDYPEGNIRNLDARFRDSHQIIATESFTYIWFDGNFDQDIIAKIDIYIENRLRLNPVVNATEIFEAFKERIISLGVTTPYHLYYIVKYYLDDKYQIGRGNTLEIFQDEQSMRTAEENLVEFLEKRGGIAKKEEICQVLKWGIYRIEQRVGDSRELIMWNGDSVRLLSSIEILPEETQELKKIIAKLMKMDYTTGDLILKEVRANEKLAPLLQREELKRPLNLLAYCKKIADLKGHPSFLVNGGGRYENIYDVISEKYHKNLSRQELREFLVGLGYGEQMPGTVIKKLLEEKKYVEVDIDEICNINSFDIKPKSVEQVITLIQNQMNNREYFIVSNLEDYRSMLPRIEFPWTPQLIKSIAINNGYKQIEKTHPDYRYEKIVIVKDDSPLNNFEDLLYHILKNEYKGTLDEHSIYAYLEMQGIVKEQDRIENKIFSSRTLTGELLEFDKMGRVHFKA